MQVSRHQRRKDAPAPPPETFGVYSKTGVIAMIDLLVKDLDEEMTEAETEEKDAQADYVTMMREVPHWFRFPDTNSAGMFQPLLPRLWACTPRQVSLR